MIYIEKFVVNMIQENCYVVSDETGEAIIIDCGAFFDNDKQRIRKYISDNKLKTKRYICTHGHFDHIIGSQFIYETYGLKPDITAEDYNLYINCDKQTIDFLGERIALTLPEIDNFIDETNEIYFGSHTLSVISTPGHTPGGVSFYCAKEKVLFSGDSLFFCSIGRTDFPYGDLDLLIEKLKTNIMVLPEDVKIYPGHGRSTTIGFEKANNPYITTF